jgi:hypothetical protein
MSHKRDCSSLVETYPDALCICSVCLGICDCGLRNDFKSMNKPKEKALADVLAKEKALADVLPAAKAASEIIRGVMRHRHFLAGGGKDDLYFRMIRAESALQDLVNGCEAASSERCQTRAHVGNPCQYCGARIY